jgi:hypothetical protein
MERGKNLMNLKRVEINLDTPEKAKLFFDLLRNPNPATKKIKQMILESPSIPRRQK